MHKFGAVLVALIVSANAAVAADVIESDIVGDFDTGRFWTGPYIGGSIGYAKVEDDDPAFPIGPGVTIPLHSEGENSTVGGFVGYTHQFDQFVLGAEYEYVDLDMQFVGDGIGPIPVFVEDAHILRARIGYAPNDQVQIYGFGGAMRTSINIGLDDWSPLVGAGVDFAITDNVVVGAQYTYTWFEDFDTTLIDGELDYFSARVSLKF